MKSVSHWLPTKWDQIVGNYGLVEYFQDMVHCIRVEGHTAGFNALVTGPSRGGKDAIIGFAMMCLACTDFDNESLNPCGRCINCKGIDHIHGNDEWENLIDYLEGNDDIKTPMRFHFIPINCARITAAQLDTKLDNMIHSDMEVRVFHLNEVHRLAPRGLDERLLVPMDQYPVNWLATSAYLRTEDPNGNKPLEKMFLNRFDVKLETQKPSEAEMAQWLWERCADWEIQVEGEKDTLSFLADLSDQVPGMALKVLNLAHKKRNRTLTRTMVENYSFHINHVKA